MRERDGLTFKPAKLYVMFLNEKGEDIQTPDEIDWDPKFNDELVRMGVNASSIESEVKRFGLTLRDRLEDPEDRYGDGFFNSVLVFYIKASPFAENARVSEKLACIHEYQPLQERSFTDCMAAIDSIIISCAKDLTALKYDQDTAVSILAGALAYYLDERFSITNRNLLGFR